MRNRNKGTILLAGFLMVVSFFGCRKNSQDARLEAILVEINNLVSDERGSVSRLPEDLKLRLNESGIKSFPENRASLEAAVLQALPYYNHDVERFETIGDKFREIAGMRLPETSLASARLQEKLYRKYVDGVMLQRSRLELLQDKSITKLDQLIERSSTIEVKLKEVEAEISNLKAESENSSVR